MKKIFDRILKKGLIRIIFAICVAIIIIYHISFSVCASDGDEVRAAKKIISVVYDDSGSMQKERWPYANYSMQALTALLNEQDELYVTYMSKPDQAMKMDTSDLDKTVQNVRNWEQSSGTPVKAVDTAKSKLDSISESDSSAQFWLVIFTDGEMFEDKEDANNGLADLVQNRLDSYKGNVMSNSTPLNIVYLGMPGALEMKADTSKGLYTYLVADDSEIVSAVNDIANLVSGRLKADKVSQTDKKTILITSKLPLYSISILSQKSSAQIKSAEMSETKLNIERNIGLDARDLKLGTPVPSLYGNAGIINNKDKNGLMTYIPAGTYTVHFSEEVDINNMTIQYEPAISLMARIQRNGVIIDDYSDLEEGDVVDIQLLPVIPGTDTVIPNDDLPNQIVWGIEYEVDGTLVDSYQGDTLTGESLKKGSNIIRGSFTIPGYAPLISEIQFDVDEYVEIVHDYGISVFQPKDLTYLRNDFKHDFLNENNTIRFSVTEDGIPMSYEELQNANLHLVITDVECNPAQGLITKIFGRVLVSCKLNQTDTGEYLLIPKENGPLPVLFLKAGEYKVSVAIQEDNSITNFGTFTVDKSIDIIDIFLPFVVLILFIYLFYYIFIKKKFKGQTVYYEDWEIVGRGAGNQVGDTISRRLGFFSGFKLFGPNSVMIKNVKLVAEKDGIHIDGKSIARNVYAYGDSALQPATSLRMISKQLAETRDEEGNRLDVPDQSLSEDYIYFQDSMGVGMLWRINMN